MKEQELKAHLKELEEKLLSDEVRTNSQEIRKYLSEDFFEFGSSGNVWCREDCLDKNGIGVRDASVLNFTMHLLADDIALATYQLDDRTLSNHTLRSSIWKLTDGHWKMFFHQGTIVPK